MDFKQLRYFVTIVEEGTISAAAKKLFMSQPPLSKQLQDMEKELRCQLFDRKGKQIVLTEAGKLLYQRALPLLNMMEVTKQEVEDYGKSHTGTIRIGITSSVVPTVISTILARYSANTPGIDLNIHESNTYQLLEQLREKTIHLGIVRTPFSAGSYKQITLLPDEIHAIGKSFFFPAHRNAITLEELAQMPLILYRRWETIVLGTFAQAGLSPRIVCRNDDARTSLSFASQGAGVALIPGPASHICEPDIKYCDITANPWKSDIVLIYDDTLYLPERVRALISFLAETCQKERADQK